MSTSKTRGDEDAVKTMRRLLAIKGGNKAWENNGSACIAVQHLDVGEEYVVLPGDMQLPEELRDELLVAQLYRKPSAPSIDDF